MEIPPKYELLVNHKSDLLSQDLILTGIYQFSNFKDFGLSFNFPYIIYNHKNGDISWLKKHVDELRTTLLSNSEYEKLISELKQNLSDHKAYLEKFKAKLHLARNDTRIIIEFFDQSIKAASSISRHMFELAIGEELKRLDISPKEIKSVRTETTKASEELKMLSKEFSDELKKECDLSNNLSKRLRDFCQKYGYLGMKHFLGRPWSVSDIYQMLQDVADQPERDEEESSSDKREHESPYLEFAEEILRLRTEKWESMCRGTYLFREMVVNHFSDIVKYDDLLELRMDEVINVLSSGNPCPKRDCDSNNSILFSLHDKGVELITNMISEDRKMDFDRNIISEIRGQPACSGKVIGKVKVVLDPKECSKIEKGDILVATMSTPDFLFGMFKAAAFVTDIGGMTCHAAIVAREMKKPCVIGTEIATKVLKDGDMVEVDAEKGVVRKLTLED